MNRLSNDLLGEISRYLGSTDIQSVAVTNRECSSGIREAYKNTEFRKPIQETNRIIKKMLENIICHDTFIFMHLDLEDKNYLDHIDTVFEYVCEYAVASLVFVSNPKVVPTEIQLNKLLNHIIYSPHKLHSIVMNGLEINQEIYDVIKDRLCPIWNELGVKYIFLSPGRIINDSVSNPVNYFTIVNHE